MYVCMYVCMYVLVHVLVCMYVCMSVTGLRLKYMGLRIVYVPFWLRAAQDAIAMEAKDSEDKRRRRNESRCMEDS